MHETLGLVLNSQVTVASSAMHQRGYNKPCCYRCHLASVRASPWTMSPQWRRVGSQPECQPRCQQCCGGAHWSGCVRDRWQANQLTSQSHDDGMVAPAWHRITWISARSCQFSDHLVCFPIRHQCWVIVHVCHLLTCHGWVFQRAVGKTSSGVVAACTCRHLPVARSGHQARRTVSGAEIESASQIDHLHGYDTAG